MSRPPRCGPPAAVRFLLRLLLPSEEQEFYLGDLEESGRRLWLREIAGAASLRFAPRLRHSPVPTSRRFASVISNSVADLRLGVRRLLRTPATTLAVLTALSVGIGLSAAMFSLIDGALLPVLPFENGDRVVRVQRSGFAPLSVEAYRYWSERQSSFEGLGAAARRRVTLAIEGEGSESASSAAMDVTTWPLLSVQPVIGRPFTDADAAPGAPAVVLVGYEIWRTRLAADTSVLGRTVRVNGELAEIVGVMPEGFGFPFSEELWTPLPQDRLRPDHTPEGFLVFGMLRDGVTADVATAELNALDRQRLARAPESAPPRVDVLAYTDLMGGPGTSRLLAGVMLGVALLVLLVACANATNVLLAQAAVRGQEVALRAVLGASRARIAAQFWIEVSVLALAGAVGGSLFAVVSVRLVRNAIPPGAGLPFWIDLRVDQPVLAFVMAAAVVAAMLAGVMPAMHASRANHELLKDASRGTSSRRLGRIMGRLIAVELAVSFVLLVAAGLFVRSAVNLQMYEFTFAPEGVYTGRVRLPDATYARASARAAFVGRLEETLASIAGASSATVTTAEPGVGGSRRAVAVEGVHDPAAADLPRPNFAAVTPRFFETFRTPLLAGRAFDSGDRAGALPVAIVSTAFASRHLPEGAVGRRIILPARDGGAEWMTIVGVASDLLAGGLDREQVDAVYRPLAQDAPMSFQVAVRSNASAAGLAAPIREAVAGLDPDVALFNMRTLDEAIDLANAQYGWMSAVFLVAGALALFLAAIGLYGVMSFWVAQRTREIGVRMAVGGTRAAILVLVLGQGTTKIAVGLAAGAVLAVPVVWLLQGALLDVKAFDPLVFGGVVAVLLGAGWLGCVRPALRATRVDPMAALTAE